MLFNALKKFDKLKEVTSMDGKNFIEEAKRLAKLEAECPCPALFKFAFERGIKLEQLRDEIRLLISMSDDEVKEYN